MSLLWFAMSVRSAAHRLLEAERQAVAYRNFFIALDEYALQTGRLPDSFGELLSAQFLVEHWEASWQEDTVYLQELIEPDFSVAPQAKNLSAFVPGYETKASWADYECEWYWERIIENCEPDE